MIWPKWIARSFCLFVIACLHQQTIVAGEVSYDELIELKSACGDLDSCQGNRTTDDLRVVNCQCGPVCAQLDTCCVDSEYRTLRKDNINSRMVATKVYHNPAVVFMVNDCKPGWVGDKGIKDLCEVPTGQAYSEDPFLLTPVTNLRNGMTYRNYYCFACNEDRSSDSPVNWELHQFPSKNLTLGSNTTLKFDGERGDYSDRGYEVSSTVGIPEKLHPYLNWYRQDVISTCDEKWTDVTIKEKCSAYTALVYYYQQNRSPIYKNPHCAICNYKTVANLRCSEPAMKKVQKRSPYRFLPPGLFSFEDEVSRCPRDQIFDRISKKCLRIRCGQNQKFLNGRCERSRS